MSFCSTDFAVKWSQLTPERIEPEITAALQAAQTAINSIAATPPDQISYATTYEALENATEKLDLGWGRLQHLDSVRDSDEQREALNKMLPVVSEFYAKIPLNTKLWNVLKTFSESSAFSSLSPLQKRLVEETNDSFINSGADLPQKQKTRIAELQSELSKVTQQFSENVLDSTNAFELIIDNEEELDGLPESAKQAALAEAISKGLATEEAPKWRFTLQFPSMFPIMQYAHHDWVRKAIWEGSSQIGNAGEHNNSELLWKIIELRQEKAGILGFSNFADLCLRRRMAKNGSTALHFIESLHQRIAPQFQEENASFRAYKGQVSGHEPRPFEPWEASYWAEKWRQDHYNLSDEELRPYFAVDKVMTGMFDIATQLFGIQITEVDSIYLEPGSNQKSELPEVWHPEVKYYAIQDQDNKETLGYFYADWHPRESKRGGAWMNCLETGLPSLNGQVRQPHLGLICGNMTKPVDGKPALLNHDEVQTVFHEFGHLLHQLLSDVPIRSLSGTNVAWDFVELPSQIMENFCWDRASLDFFARHFETGETIPEELFQKMVAARNFMSASGFMRQLSLGKLDLELHLHSEKYLHRDLDEIDREILADYKSELARPVPTIARRFSHLFSSPTGYAAGYYSYKWAEVLDADAFTRFQKEGVTNRKTGKAFRDAILSKGNSRPAEELYRDFMNRDPDQEALLKRSGLVSV